MCIRDRTMIVKFLYFIGLLVTHIKKEHKMNHDVGKQYMHISEVRFELTDVKCMISWGGLQIVYDKEKKWLHSENG